MNTISYKEKNFFQKLDTKLKDLKINTDTKENISSTTYENDNNKNFKTVIKDFFLDFSIYEIIWMVIIFALSLFLSVALPEEDVLSESTGELLASGTLITVLYFFDTIIGCFCELLFSKQNKWAFLIYDLVELIEIICMLLLRTRFASIAVCIFFWIPAHTAGFFSWRKHKDEKRFETTKVRKLKKWQTILIMTGTVILSAVLGYFMAKINPDTNFYSSDFIEKISAYADACLAVMSILDGILMFCRSRESWWTWYIYVAVETFFNILNGQWVLLVYKFGYLSNGIYGSRKWRRYINENEQ